jgi:Tol biopolymer transport system component
MIFASDRPGGYGRTDLYISFAGDEGDWGEPRNLGPLLNSSGFDYSPMMSPDGKILFFTRHLEGDANIYWVDASAIHLVGSAAPASSTH